MSAKTEHLAYLIFKASTEGSARPDYFMHLQIPLNVLVSVCGHLQIALRTIARDPRRFEAYDENGNRIKGASSELVRQTVRQVIERMKEDGLYYNAQFLEESWERDLSEPDDAPRLNSAENKR